MGADSRHPWRGGGSGGQGPYARPMDAAIVLGLVLVAMVLFAIERVPIEVASLVLMVLIALSGVLTPAEAFAGISNETVIFIFALLAMTRGLGSTGVMQIVGRRAAFATRFGERTFSTVLFAVVAGFSSIASNTAVTAAFLPVVSAAAARARIPRSRILLPMAYSSMLGGTILLFGTSTNLVVSEAMAGMGMRRIGFSELAVIGLPLTCIAIAWMVFTRGRLPVRKEQRGDEPLAHRKFVTEAVPVANSRLLGRDVVEAATDLGLDVIAIVRKQTWIPAEPGVRIGPRDRLIIRGGRHEILRVKDLRSVILGGEAQEEGPPGPATILVEAFVPPHSPLVGRSLHGFLFRERLGLAPLALHRHPTVELGRSPHEAIFEARSIERVRLDAGDVILLSGPPRRMRGLAQGDLLTILGTVAYQRPRYRKAGLALLIFAAAVGAAGARVVPPAIAGLTGMLAMIATRCVDAADAFRVEWRVVLLIGSLLALGAAMEASGAGALVAGALLPVAEIGGPRAALFTVMLLTVLLSAPMSNQAAALVLLPVGVQIAQMLGVDARPFAIGTCLAASCSFVTPLEPSAALVYGPGHYRFSDFVRAGTPLTLLALVLLTVAVPWFWPFG